MTNELVIKNGVLVMKPNPNRQTARETLAQKVLVGAGLVGGLTGFSVGMVRSMDVAVPAPLLAIGAVLIIGGLIWTSLIYWRLLDEAAKEAHKFAWFWGGCGALLLTLPAMLLVDTATLEAMFGPRDADDWLVAGMQVVVLTQIAGYALAWSGWWLVRRR